jgi:WD40 repeat protein
MPVLRALVAPSPSSSDRVVIRAPSGRRVISVAFVDDATKIAAWCIPVGARDTSNVTTHVWDAASGREMPTPPLPFRPATSSRDGSLRLELGGPGGGWGAPVRVHDKQGGLVASLETDDETHVSAAALSGDGTRVAAGGYGLETGVLIAWSVVSQQPLASLLTDEHIYAVAMSADGRVIASGNVRGVVEIWRSEGGAAITASQVHDGSIVALAIAPDGRIASASDDDGTLRISRVENEVRQATPHPDAIVDVAFSADGSRLVTCSENGTTWLWDAATGEPIRCLFSSTMRVLEGGRVRSAIFAGSSQIVSLAHGGAIWDAASGAAVVLPSEPVLFARTRVSFSPNGRFVLVVPPEGEARISPALDLAKGARMAGRIHCHAWYTSTRIALGDEEGQVVIGDARSGTFRQWFHAHRGPVTAIAAAGGASSGACLTAGADNHIRFWSFTGEGSAACVGTLVVDFPVAGLGVSSRGEIVTLSPSGAPFNPVTTVRSLDLTTRKTAETLTGIVDLPAWLLDRPWRAVIRDKMFVVESAETREPIAWAPTALTAFTTHPTRPMWAGAVGNRLHWLVLDS